MSYYLKYRPQKIAELDLVSVREVLEKTLKAKSVPHAWLLSGPKGSGKTSAARIIAKSVNCAVKRNAPEPCNHCDVCRAITKGTAIDVMEIDAASNRGIDDIRELKEKIKLAPTSLKFKVYIIDEVHMLTKEAFNALLKTLEEPPDFAVFILATTEVDKLPETIVSRCFEIKFTKATESELMRSLKRVVKGEKLKIKEERLRQTAASADGSFRDAVKLLEHPLKTRPFRLDDWLGLVYKRQGREAINWLLKAWAQGVQPRQLILAAIERLRQAWLYHLGEGGEDLGAVDDTAQLKQLIGRFLAAAAEVKTAAVETLPLELAVAEWCGANASAPAGEAGQSPQKTTVGNPEVAAKWPKVLEAVKPLNHSLEALLRATEPIGFEGGFLIIKVFYQFHKDRLEEERYRQMVEQVASKVLVAPIKIKFFFSPKPVPAKEDIIKTAEEVFGVSVGGD